ncbi:MAG: NAD(P)(+) transhydrogenase (Re/Si-specific) subunit alpha [Flammeovirgaceae bacterium]|nr:NAD(P)(+) transhydrogenase (Re/Si-specific) subunit alpha [Flammeovirgaceae bacterium]
MINKKSKSIKNYEFNVRSLMVHIGILKSSKQTPLGVTPDSLKKWPTDTTSFMIEKDAGLLADISDDEFLLTGAQIVSRTEVIEQSNLLVISDALTEKDLTMLPVDTVIVGLLNPHSNKDFTTELKKRNQKAFALELLPRTSIAQSMDVLSAMASLAGYKSVILAANYFVGYFPMLTTAAGTVPPAKVLVLGAGVAGLQAIATAKRLGAVVEAFDVRKVVKEEVESLGAKFIMVEGMQNDMDTGGYATAQKEEELTAQRKLIHQKVIKADIVITTASIPGKSAPRLIEGTTVDGMKPGSVIIDLAAASGGNCELTKNEEAINHSGVNIIGDSQLAYTLTHEASKLFSVNIFNFINHLMKGGLEAIDFEDEIVKSTFIGNN